MIKKCHASVLENACPFNENSLQTESKTHYW